MFLLTQWLIYNYTSCFVLLFNVLSLSSSNLQLLYEILQYRFTIIQFVYFLFDIVCPRIKRLVFLVYKASNDRMVLLINVLCFFLCLFLCIFCTSLVFSVQIELITYITFTKHLPLIVI